MKLNLPPFEQARVLVVGDLMLDRYWHGDTGRISPEAPVPVVHVRDADERPGGAGNVALNLASLGVGVTLVGMTGDDEAADTLADRLAAAGIDCRLLRQAGMPTVTKLRIMSRHQQLIRLDFEEGFAGCDPAPLLATCRAAVEDAGALVLSDYGKGTLQQLRPLIGLARQAGIPVLVDPKHTDFSHYAEASLITPNQAEFEAVVGPCRNEGELVARGQALIRAHRLGGLLITRGEQGMTLLREGAPERHLPARAREVYDVTGAGDTVIAVLAGALAAGSDLEEATGLANLAAGIVVGKLGTATVTLPELQAATRLQQEAGQGVLSRDQLQLALAQARTAGERIVMTNGCFDILHAGHVGYLAAARRLGDRLVVAVNDDDSVRRLKGPGRPVNPLARRMSVLAALASVDWVVPFGEDTPEDLICDLAPDVLVKGGDYRPQDIAGHDCVIRNGGKVVVLDYEEGCSTTDIIQRIRQNED